MHKHLTRMRVSRRIPLTLTVAALSGAAMAGPAGASDTTRDVDKPVPVVIDGVRHAPQKLSNFARQARHFELRKGRRGKPELVATQGPPRRMHRARASSPGGWVRFWDKRPNVGAPHTFDRNHGDSVANLSNVGRWCLLWWCDSTFNDVIAYVETRGAHTTLFDQTYFAGASVSIPGEWDAVDLVSLGFKGRASSLWVD